MIKNLGGKNDERGEEGRREQNREDREMRKTKIRETCKCKLHFCYYCSSLSKIHSPTLFIGSYPTVMKSYLMVAG